MKKYIQIIVAFIIVVGVVAIARNGSAWASGLPGGRPSFLFSERAAESSSAQDSLELAPPRLTLDITGSGSYNIGGICLLEVTYTGTDLRDQADAEVPVEQSSQVLFSGEGKLFYPGCHIVHYKDNEIVRETSSQDGDWTLCFGTNADLSTQIYYYLDDPDGGVKVWIPITTFTENGLSCANAPFTGVYMPAGRPVSAGGSPEDWHDPFPDSDLGGSVVPPPPGVTVTESGTYSVGGICAVILQYYIPGLADNLHVEFPTQDTKIVPFPNPEELLYLPGCHLLHYRDAKIRQEMTREEGDWEICFAARPDKEMTIYFYRDDNTDIAPPWVPLETTTKDGLACAPLADYSGVYAPAGR